MKVAEFEKLLGAFPRKHFLWEETPIIFAENMSSVLDIELYIKRDDLSGMALGGNKTRKLEFILGDVIKGGYDTVITAGACHSNHALQTAVCAKKLGLDAVLALRGEEKNKGSLFAAKIAGADVRVYDVKNSSMLNDAMEDISDELKAQGRKPYIIPVGGSCAIGTLGYINAVCEISRQAKELGINFDYVVLPTSSGGTQVGTLLGFELLSKNTKVLGIGVGDPREELIDDVFNLACDTIKKLGLPENLISLDKIRQTTIDGYGFGGYGTIVPEVLDIIKLAAQKEGFYLDPVYTGKAFYGLCDMAKEKILPQDSKVLFIHTGGLGGLFYYDDVISNMMKF